MLRCTPHYAPSFCSSKSYLFVLHVLVMPGGSRWPTMRPKSSTLVRKQSSSMHKRLKAAPVQHTLLHAVPPIHILSARLKFNFAPLPYNL